MTQKGPIKTPVYSLKKGDSFIGDDGRTWIVDEIIEPSDWRVQLQVNTKPKNWEIKAHAAGSLTRTFFYQGSKLVERR
jgi:hypothetical protein